MTRDPKALYDGAIDLRRGVDSGNLPSVIGQDQVSFAVNTTFRGGFAQQRPGWEKIGLTYASGATLTADEVQKAFQDGLYQGASVYRPDTEFPLIAVSVAGKFFTINLRSNEVRNIPAPDKDNSTILPKAWFVQAENFLILQDNQAPPLVFNGGGLVREDPSVAGSIPVGNIMAYGNGRLWVARPNKMEFVAGDLVYSTTGKRRDVLRFTENEFLNGGGSFGVPDSAGPITGMQFMAVQDTSLGQGPLHVSTANTIFTVSAPFDREQWQNLSYPIQTVSQIGFGAVSHNSIVLVNGDMFYRAFDGFRSYILAARSFGEWGNTPVSREMNRVLLRDTRSLLSYGSAVVYDNRLIATCIPQFVAEHGVIHKGLAILDFDLLGAITGKAAPAWEGLWTGLNILQLLKFDYDGEEYCYALCLNPMNQIELWQLSREWRFDNRTDRIKSIIEFRSMDFQSAGVLKELEQADIWVDRLAGTTKFSMKYRPDQYPCWTNWGDDKEVCSNFEDCDTTDGICATVTNYQEQMRTRVGFGTPGDEFLASDLKKMRSGYEFQPRLEIDGPFRLRGLRIKARHTPEEPFHDQVK